MVSMEAQAASFETLREPFALALGARSASVADAVYRTVRSAIVRMELLPGARLTEQELADALSTSRQPVREALLRLRDVDLVEARGTRGSFVARISPTAVRSAQFVREAIETAIVRRASAGLPEHSQALLKEILRDQERAAARGDSGRFFALDEDFHRTLAAAVGCGPAWKTIEDVKGQMDRVRYLSLPDATPVERLIAQHRDILEGVLAGDPDRAAHGMHQHLGEIIISLPTLAARHPALFTSDEP